MMRARNLPRARVGVLARFRVLVSDTALMVGLHVAAPFRHFPKRWRHGDPDKPVILLVPGVYETWPFLEPIAERLHRQGYRITVVRGLGYNTEPIVDTASRLARALGRGPVPRAGRVILAHSKGGLIGKQLLLGHGDDLGIRAVIAIASPFAGSRYARYLLDPRLRAFVPGDATILALSAHAEANAKIASIYGPFDPHVPDGSVLAGATNLPVDVSGHFRILRAPVTRDAVEQALRILLAPGRAVG